jgi:uncharacterized phage protein (TIGR01671 family)
MREIKIEVMFEVHNSDFTKKIAKHYTSVDRLTSGQDKFKYNEVDIIAKRQFTGLQDKDGVDIYEDDIVDGVIHQDYSINIGRVLYDYNGYRILTLTKSVQFTLTEKLTVIGNIYENPELLESVK